MKGGCALFVLGLKARVSNGHNWGGMYTASVFLKLYGEMHGASLRVTVISTPLLVVLSYNTTESPPLSLIYLKPFQQVKAIFTKLQTEGITESSNDINAFRRRQHPFRL